MLANTKVPFKVNLTKLATEHKRECTYEQEISSSADFKFADLHVTIRVFHTGAIVMLGGRLPPTPPIPPLAQLTPAPV
jgi:TATA-box binding protein (TBP) (component of TFIID and TFIIIB)